MKRLGIIAALPAEGRLFNRHLTAGQIQPLSEQQLLYVCGIGAEAATRASRTLIASGVDGLLSWGCAGGLRDDCRPGDLFLPDSVVSADTLTRYPVDRDWHTDIGTRLKQRQILYRDAPLVSVDQVLTGSTHKQQLARKSGAALVDMESAAIAAVAQQHGVAFLCIRAIADDLQITVPASMNGLLNRFGQVDLKRLMPLMLLRPQLLLQTLKLGYAFTQARRSLRQVIAASPGLVPVEDL